MGTDKNGKKKGRGLMAIAALKLLEGVGLLILGLGALHFVHADQAKEIGHWIDFLRGDPHSRSLIWLLQKLSILDDHRLRQLSVGTFTYAGVFLCEGTGLAFKKRWAEWLTIGTTASLMPVEVYEIFKHPTAPKFGVFALNIVVVGYLIWELRREKKSETRN
jgi:uncharacterized membrane protein (DUF2068 family)